MRHKPFRILQLVQLLACDRCSGAQTGIAAVAAIRANTDALIFTHVHHERATVGAATTHAHPS